jgi:curved DNA-binding protein CbpA
MQVLEVGLDADEETLKTAKRQKALLVHPDKNAAAVGSSQAMARILEVWRW